VLCCVAVPPGNAARPLVRDLVKGTAGQAKFNNPDRPAVSLAAVCYEEYYHPVASLPMPRRLAVPCAMACFSVVYHKCFLVKQRPLAALWGAQFWCSDFCIFV
jgi:hypothetical protein